MHDEPGCIGMGSIGILTLWQQTLMFLSTQSRYMYALKISKLNEMDEISKVHATMIVEMVKEKIVHFA